MTHDHKATSPKSGLPVRVHVTICICVWLYMCSRSASVCKCLWLIAIGLEIRISVAWETVWENNICTWIAQADKRRALFNSAPVTRPYPGLDKHRPSDLSWPEPSMTVFRRLHNDKLRRIPRKNSLTQIIRLAQVIQTALSSNTDGEKCVSSTASSSHFHLGDRHQNQYLNQLTPGGFMG